MFTVRSARMHILILCCLHTYVPAERVYYYSLIPTTPFPPPAPIIPELAPQPRALKETKNPVSTAVNDFSVDLFSRLAQDNEGKNVFVSPFSISTTLSMLLLGARSTSADELRQGLRFNQMDGRDGKTVHQMFNQFYDEGIRRSDSVSLSNYMLVEKEEKDNPVLYKYKKDMDQLYGAKVDDVDFDGDTSKIQTDVNQWVRSRTNGLIDSIMDSPPDPSTTAIILNAIYFKGTWVKSFDKQNTQRRKFVTRNFEKLDADFMTMKGDRFLYQKLPLAGEEVQVLEMPYASDSMSMVILLPSRTKGVQNMMSSERFASEMETLLANLNELLSKRVINLMIPKFKLQSEYSVIPTLEKMGIKHIFTPGSADLSGINGRSDLVVSEVKHKAVVEVDEEGTEAAGGTFAAIQPPSVLVEPIRSIEFRVDHPFIFLIRDRVTGLLYFVGKVEAL